jgi:DNA-binding XRE family transcriptional regulator
MNNKVRKYRERMGLTQIQFAMLLDIKYQPRIAEIESGKVLPRYPLMLKISRLLKQPVERIFVL